MGVVFHSQPMSVYLWTASLVAAEKGVPWSVQIVEPGSPRHLRLNPLAKSPVLQHEAIFLYETLAIAHYLDEVFEGPALQPRDPLHRAEMLKWVSLVNAYIFPTMTNGLAKQRLLVPAQGGQADEALVAQAVEASRLQLSLIERDLASYPFLAGSEISIADCFLFPHLHLASMTPEGAALLNGARRAGAWLARMRARPSHAATDQLRKRAA